MNEVTEKKTKEFFINEIVNEINDIPSVYYKTLYAIIHSFKENLPNLQIKKINHSTENQDEFDWDELLSDVMKLRRTNNLKLFNNAIDNK